MENHLHWRIVLTRAGAEKKVCDQLKKRGIQHFYPVCTTGKKNMDRMRTQTLPVFDKYIFVHLTEQHQFDIKSIEGARGWVYYRDKPANIPAAEVNMIKRFLHEHSEVKTERIAVDTSAIADASRIGYLTGDTYQVVSLTDNLEKIVLPFLGFAMVAEKVQAKVDVIRIGSPKYYFQSLFNNSYR